MTKNLKLTVAVFYLIACNARMPPQKKYELLGSPELTTWSIKIKFSKDTFVYRYKSFNRSFSVRGNWYSNHDTIIVTYDCPTRKKVRYSIFNGDSLTCSENQIISENLFIKSDTILTLNGRKFIPR